MPELKSIALVTDGIYPYVLGGMQKHSYYLAKYLSQNGIQVHLFHYIPADARINSIEDFFTQEELENINFYEADFPGTIRYPGHYLTSSYRYSDSIYHQLISKIKEVDFIYVQGFTGWKLFEERDEITELPPIGVNLHGLEIFQKAATLRVRLEQLLLQYPAVFSLRKADYVFSLGGKLTGILQNIVRNQSVILEIPIGIDKSWLRLNQSEEHRRRKFMFVGRYERRKGIEEMNSVLRRLVDKFDFEFNFVGPIPKRKRLKIKSDKIIYHGAVRDEVSLKKLYSETDFLVCPSYSEGMPNVVLEAMASKASVIATDVGAVNCLVTKSTGILVPKINTSALEKAMIEAIHMPEEKLKKNKDSSIELIKNNYTMENVIKMTIEKLIKITAFNNTAA